MSVFGTEEAPGSSHCIMYESLFWIKTATLLQTLSVNQKKKISLSRNGEKLWTTVLVISIITALTMSVHTLHIL